MHGRNDIPNGAVSPGGAGVTVMRRLLLSLACAWLALGLAACETVTVEAPPTVRDASVVAPANPAGPDPVQEPTDVKYYPSDAPLRMGLEQFNRGNYGIAQQLLQGRGRKGTEGRHRVGRAGCEL